MIISIGTLYNSHVFDFKHTHVLSEEILLTFILSHVLSLFIVLFMLSLAAIAETQKCHSIGCIRLEAYESVTIYHDTKRRYLNTCNISSLHIYIFCDDVACISRFMLMTSLLLGLLGTHIRGITGSFTV